jgi:hypothetical protein
MGAAGEMHDDFDTVEMPRPVGRGADISDRVKFDAADGFRRPPGYADHGMVALDEADAQRTADEAGRTSD